MDFVTTALDRENLVDLIPLIHRVLGKVTDRAHLEAKYKTGHLGLPSFGYFAHTSDGRPVAFFGAIPTLLEKDGQIELAAQCCDAVTIEEFAGRGLFTQLGRLTETRLRDFGIRSVFAFLNQNSEPAALGKLGWTGIHRMRRFTVPVLTIPLDSLSRKISAGPAYRAWVTTKLAARIRADHFLANSVLEDGIVGSHRNREFYAYKIAGNSFIIEVAGVKMWVKLGGGLLIGDIERRPEVEILVAVGELRRIARSLGIAGITFQASPGTYLERIFSRHFAGFDSWLLGGKSFDPRFPIEALRCTLGDLDTF